MIRLSKYSKSSPILFCSSCSGITISALYIVSEFKDSKEEKPVEEKNNEQLAEEYFQKAREAYNNKNYSSAMEYANKSVGLGSFKAYNVIGLCYSNGNGVGKDYKKAFEYFKKAAATLFLSADRIGFTEREAL